MNYNYQGVGGVIDWVFEIDMYNVNAILKIGNQQRCTVEHRELLNIL